MAAGWNVVHAALWVVFLLAAVLPMLHLRAGFLTGHAADVVAARMTGETRIINGDYPQGGSSGRRSLFVACWP